MANYYGTERTNYFHVKDRKAFDEWASKRGFQVIERDGLVGLMPPAASDECTFNTYDPDENEEFDLLEEVSKHLLGKDVCILMGSGHEKLRYISGYAEAINSKGERKRVDIGNIYDLARTLGCFTYCEY